MVRWGVGEVLQGVSLFSRTSRLPLRVRGWRCACARGCEPRRISILEIGELSRGAMVYVKFDLKFQVLKFHCNFTTISTPVFGLRAIAKL